MAPEDRTRSNLLVTGPPRSGKTTVVERTVDRLTDAGVDVGGLFSPEVREGGERIGFDLVDATSPRQHSEASSREGTRRVPLARVDRASGPSVGKYRVDVDAVDRFVRQVLVRADAHDVVVIDEIAPMQVTSDAFVRETERLLDATQPVLAAVKQGSTSGFVGREKERPDAELFEVTPDTRDELPERVAARLQRAVDGRGGSN